MASSASDNPSLSNVLTELFECVVHQKESSLVKAGVTLGQLASTAEASDSRVQARCGAIVEEMKGVSGYVVHESGMGEEGGRAHTRGQLCSLFTSAHLLHLFVQLDQKTLQEHGMHKKDWEEHRDKLFLRYCVRSCVVVSVDLDSVCAGLLVKWRTGFVSLRRLVNTSPSGSDM